MENIRCGNTIIPFWLYAPLAFLLWFFVLQTAKRILFSRIRAIAKHTKTQLDDILIDALNFPLTIIIFFSGLTIIQKTCTFTDLPQLSTLLANIFKAACIFAIILFFDKLLQTILDTYAVKITILRSSKGVIKVAIRIAILATGLLIVLDSFGISITPILASLGIGSLAVALALQPTLENLFSGIQLIADKPIEPGQFIQLETGEEGYVEKIGWRSTWIRLLPNNMIILPNKTLVNSKILNYCHPTRESAVLVEVGVHYDSDLDQVKKVTVEVAEEIMNTVNGGISEFKPFIRFHTFADSSLNFTVILRAKEFVDSYLIKHEFIKRLHERYKKEGIVIPYPIRAINTQQEQKKG
jgi:small-conductance mechanosensitive channel